MTHRENLFGWFYFPIYWMVLPTAINLVGSLFGLTISPTVLNILYDVINFICIIGIFHAFLWASVKAAWEKPLKCLRYAFQGFLIYYACELLLSVILAPWVGPWFSNVNDETVIALSQEHTGLFIFCSVLLVPIIEETLFRGLIFQSLHHKGRILSYCVSVAAFAAIHVVGYVGAYDYLTLLLCFLQYLPAGIALAMVYEQADTIVAPITMHIIVNLIAFIVSR